MLVYFCKQKTAYEMRISDWSSDVCSSDLAVRWGSQRPGEHRQFFPALHFICLGCCHSGHCRSIQSSKQKSCRAQMLRAQPPLHRTGADFHRSADTASDTVEKRKAEGLYLFGMWGTGVAPAVTFCQHG